MENGREFLGKVIKEMPFKVKAIQIDGGSELKAEFDAECEARGIDLWILPPKSPELNGCVERTNGTWRCEFHGCWEIEYEDIVKVNRCIEAFTDAFNRIWPHGSLGGLTAGAEAQDRRQQRRVWEAWAIHNPIPKLQNNANKDCPQALHALRAPNERPENIKIRTAGKQPS